MDKPWNTSYYYYTSYNWGHTENHKSHMWLQERYSTITPKIHFPLSSPSPSPLEDNLLQFLSFCYLVLLHWILLKTTFWTEERNVKCVLQINCCKNIFVQTFQLLSRFFHLFTKPLSSFTIYNNINVNIHQAPPSIWFKYL